MSALETPWAPLGVGSIVGQSVSVFFRRIVLFVLLAFVPILATSLLLASVVGLDFEAALAERMVGPQPGDASTGFLWLIGAFIAIGNALFVVVLAVMVQAAYDTRLRRGIRTAAYLGGALRRIVPLLLCSLVVVVLFYAAAVLLLIPGLWVLAVFSVVIPVVVIEGRGFASLGRSAALTKGYRWPIVGALILLSICAILLSLVLGLVTGVLGIAAASIGSGGGGWWGTLFGTVWQSLSTAATFGIPCIGVSLIYARLREIKEGASVESLAEVFA